MIDLFVPLLWQAAKCRWQDLTYDQFREAMLWILDAHERTDGRGISVLKMVVFLEQELLERYGDGRGEQPSTAT